MAPVSKFELCTSAYEILWGPANWVAPCVAEMEAILPYLTGVHRDSARAAHGVSTKAYTWKTTRVRWALIIYLTALWTVATHGTLLAHVCCVFRLLSLQGFNWLEPSWLPLDMGNTCLLESFSSNSTFIMLHLYHEVDVNYLVVEEMINIKIVWLQLHA
jgi:hypothetical protein